MKKIFIGSIATFVVALVVWRVLFANSSVETRRQVIPIVQTELPMRQTILVNLKFNGDAVPSQQASIYSKVGGTLDQVFVNIGSRVRQGQILAIIDTTELFQQVQQTGATYENARLNFERTKELAAQNLIATQELDNGNATMKVAQANYETAVTRLGYAHIVAPFPGTITKRFLDPGANVKSNDAPLFTLMDIDEMKIVLNILERDIPFVSRGKRAVVTVDAYPGKEFTGSVTRISEAVELSTRTMAVEVDIPNQSRLLKPGMFANIKLLVDEHRNALTIKSQALAKDDRGEFVYCVVNGAAHRHEVKSGMEENSKTEVLSGLSDGDSVIVTGQQFVKEGSLVNVQP